MLDSGVVLCKLITQSGLFDVNFEVKHWVLKYINFCYPCSEAPKCFENWGYCSEKN